VACGSVRVRWTVEADDRVCFDFTRRRPAAGPGARIEAGVARCAPDPAAPGFGPRPEKS
jgi:hypothetical protein